MPMDLIGRESPNLASDWYLPLSCSYRIPWPGVEEEFRTRRILPNLVHARLEERRQTMIAPNAESNDDSVP